MKNFEVGSFFFIHTLWNFETFLMVFFGVFDFSRCFAPGSDRWDGGGQTAGLMAGMGMLSGGLVQN